MSLQQGITILR